MAGQLFVFLPGGQPLLFASLGECGSHVLVQGMQAVPWCACVRSQALAQGAIDAIGFAEQTLLQGALGQGMGGGAIEFAVGKGRLNAVHAMDVAQRAVTVLAL